MKHSAIAAILILVLFITGCAVHKPRKSMTSEEWTESVLNAAFCEEQPCNKKTLEGLMGPMRTDQEWRRFAEAGDKQAQSQQCSAHGIKEDVDPDYYLKVITWCHVDANAGDVAAAYLLGRLYATGHGGVDQSWEEAYFWYSARIIDIYISTVERDNAVTHLTHEQRAKVDSRVKNWKAILCASKPMERNDIVRRNSHCRTPN